MFGMAKCVVMSWISGPQLVCSCILYMYSTCISRVHGDEHSTRGIQFDLSTLKQQSIVPRVDASLNGHDLLGHHWQHLQVNAVELIEAGPGSAWCQTLEEFSQSNVVQPIRAVKHHTLHTYMEEISWFKPMCKYNSNIHDNSDTQKDTYTCVCKKHSTNHE